MGDGRTVSVLRVAGMILVVSCSSSGSGPSGNAAGDNSSGDAYSVSPAKLAFEGRAGGLRPAAQSVEVAAHGVQLYVKTEISGAAVESAMVEVTGDQSATVSIQPASPVDVPDGTSMASVSIVGCKDPVCSGQVAGSPKTVAVTYHKSAGGLTGMPSNLMFKQIPGGAAPAAQSVALSDLGGGSFAWTSSINYHRGSGWLAVTPSAGNMLPDAAGVSIVPTGAAGTNDATLAFAVGTTSLFQVGVTYTVSADFHVMPDPMNVVGAFGMPTPDHHLSLTDGLGESYSWTVQTEYQAGELTGWVTVSPTSGAALPADVVVSLGAMPDRLSHFATLRVTAAGTEHLISLSYRTP
jgi:hypothetical protein